MNIIKKHPDLCYCNSNLPFYQCCKPLLDKKHQAETAEQLMRSRYSAFCCVDIDYLLSTHHPAQLSINSRQQIAQSAEQCHWLGLHIKNSHLGTNADTIGTVEFVATYQQNDILAQHHELSHFVKEQNQWFYTDGEIFESDPEVNINPGRNSPCWCGSGKKFKKCHG